MLPFAGTWADIIIFMLLYGGNLEIIVDCKEKMMYLARKGKIKDKSEIFTSFGCCAL